MHIKCPLLALPSVQLSGIGYVHTGGLSSPPSASSTTAPLPPLVSDSPLLPPHPAFFFPLCECDGLVPRESGNTQCLSFCDRPPHLAERSQGPSALERVSGSPSPRGLSDTPLTCRPRLFSSFVHPWTLAFPPRFGDGE